MIRHLDWLGDFRYAGAVDQAPDDQITYLARATHRNAGTLFGIRRKDRRSHMYVIGKTGTGKSHFLKLMMMQDIANGEGFALFDPHGDLARDVAAIAQEHRPEDTVYIDSPDAGQPWRFNPVADVPETHWALAAAGIVEVFKKLWADDWGPRLEHILRNVAFTLLEAPDTSLADVPLMLADKSYRRGIISHVTNQVVRDFWYDEFDKYSPAFRAMAIAPLQNKVGALLTDPVSRRILTEPGDLIDLRALMDANKILIVNLDKGRIGEGPAALIGSLLVSHIGLAALSRSDTVEEKRVDFAIYMDEFQTFTTASLATMLSELRKYRAGLVISSQHLSQIDPVIRAALFGNIGTLIAFRVGASDAQYLAREFADCFSAEDLASLPRHNVTMKLLLNGEQSKSFSAAVPGDLTT